jgi:hypothetical protein
MREARPCTLERRPSRAADGCNLSERICSLSDEELAVLTVAAIGGVARAQGAPQAMRILADIARAGEREAQRRTRAPGGLH